MEHKFALTLRNFSSKSKDSLKILISTTIGNKQKNLLLKISAPLFNPTLNHKQEKNTPITSTKCT